MKCGVIMDSIAHIKIHKDTSFAMLLEGCRRQYDLYYIEPENIWFQGGLTWAKMYKIRVFDDPEYWYEIFDPIEQPLVELDVCLMRKDPPFNMDYIYLTYLLELAKDQGLLVLNNPTSLRDANEKLFTTYFPQCCPPTLISRQQSVLRGFIDEQKEVVVKPLDKMGGESIFRLTRHDPNLGVILETITEKFTRLIVAQQFIPEVKYGDKRILLIDGKPVPYAFARKAKPGEFRANLATGGTGEGQPLSDRDYWIAEQVGPTLKQKGLLFVGLDVIGDYLTEINVTSPTCARELDAQFGINIAGMFFDVVEQKLADEDRY